MISFKNWCVKEATSIINYKKLAQMGVADLISDPVTKKGLYLNIDSIDKNVLQKMKDNVDRHKSGSPPLPFLQHEVEKLEMSKQNEKIYSNGFIEGGYYEKSSLRKLPPTFLTKDEKDIFNPSSGIYIWINLIDRSKVASLWKTYDGKLPKDYYQLVSISTRNSHFYTCTLDLQAQFKLAHDPRAKSEPRNRIRTRALISFGNQIANIIIQNKKMHPLYDKVVLK
jgi:hypothetical protein